MRCEKSGACVRPAPVQGIDGRELFLGEMQEVFIFACQPLPVAVSVGPQIEGVLDPNSRVETDLPVSRESEGNGLSNWSSMRSQRNTLGNHLLGCLPMIPIGKRFKSPCNSTGRKLIGQALRPET